VPDSYRLGKTEYDLVLLKWLTTNMSTTFGGLFF